MARRDSFTAVLQAPYGAPKGENMVSVLDRHKKTLMPCSEKRARILLSKKRAVIHKMMPFTIRIKDRLIEKSIIKPLRVKIDPGAKITGIAVITEENKAEALYLGEIHHRTDIKSSLDTRRAIRRSRRNRKTRYRKARFLNRKRREGWLPPSLQSRVNQVLTVVDKLGKLFPVKFISMENVKFDTQLMNNPEITGVEYQQGTLKGYEVREYLLEKYKRTCVYCRRTYIPLEVEHIIPKSRGGSNRISNLTISCKKCNQKKGNKTAKEFGYPLIEKEAKKSLKDAAFMNSTRWALYNALSLREYTIDCGTGARTKKQRIERGLPKTHYFDALCTGKNTPERIIIKTNFYHIWKAHGRGHRRIANIDKYGFPKSHKENRKIYFGFTTGDTVKASIPHGKYKGIWTGRVLTRKSGYFDMKNIEGKRITQGVSQKYIKLLQRNNGWLYGKLPIPPTAKAVSLLGS